MAGKFAFWGMCFMLPPTILAHEAICGTQEDVKGQKAIDHARTLLATKLSNSKPNEGQIVYEDSKTLSAAELSNDHQTEEKDSRTPLATMLSNAKSEARQTEDEGSGALLATELSHSKSNESFDYRKDCRCEVKVTVTALVFKDGEPFGPGTQTKIKGYANGDRPTTKEKSYDNDAGTLKNGKDRGKRFFRLDDGTFWCPTYDWALKWWERKEITNIARPQIDVITRTDCEGNSCGGMGIRAISCDDIKAKDGTCKGKMDCYVNCGIGQGHKRGDIKLYYMWKPMDVKRCKGYH